MIGFNHHNLILKYVLERENKSMFEWGKKDIEWYDRGNKQDNYFYNLTKELMASIPSTGKVWDIGCGLGYLSMALAQQGRTVIAVDVSENAIRHIDQNKGNLDITTRLGDYKAFLHQIEPEDTLIFCMFGKLSQELATLHATRYHQIITINLNRNTRSFRIQPSVRKKGCLSDNIAYLEQMGIGYTLKEKTFDFCQPIMDMEDGVAFIASHNVDCEQQAIRDYVTQHLQPLERTKVGCEYYFPNKKEMGILLISGKENE